MAMALQVVVVVVVRRQWMSPVWTSELAGSSRHGSIPTLTPYMWRKVREEETCIPLADATLTSSTPNVLCSTWVGAWSATVH